MPIMVPPASVTGELLYYWVDPNGVVRNLSRSASPNLFVSMGSTGLGMSTFDIEDEKYPVHAGKLIRHISTPERKLSIPITIHEDSLGDLVLAMEDLYDWFYTGDETTNTPGYFRVVRPDNTSRQIACYYTGGLEGDLGQGWIKGVTKVVELYAPDPWPADISDTVVTKTVAQAANFAVINQGKVPAYPIWRLDGPFTNVTIHNVTTDKTIESTVAILTGAYMIIDTRPSELRPGFSVYDNLGNNIQNTIDPSSEFWSLQRGSNNIQVTFTSGTSSNTLVTLTYLAKYRSLLR